MEIFINSRNALVSTVFLRTLAMRIYQTIVTHGVKCYTCVIYLAVSYSKFTK